jgi:hypothetical protein
LRSLGALLVAIGLFGFIYSSDQLGKAPPLPEDMSWRQALDEPAGMWETARYACALAGGIGLLLLLYPKGR